MSPEHQKFMELAIEEARRGLEQGEKPFGSVIVRNAEIVGRACNTENSTGDPTAHAETKAVREAAANLGTPILSECTMYTSSDPCPMCAYAGLTAKIRRFVIGARHEPLARMRGIEPRTYTVEKLADMLHIEVDVVRGVQQEEAEEVLAQYRYWHKTYNPIQQRS